MGAFYSWFLGEKPVERRPLKGPLPKIKNIFKVHHRGLLGCFFPLVLLPWQPERGEDDITVRCMWIWMFFFYLFKPVSVPATSFIPLFLLPMTGTLSSLLTCTCYFDDNIALYILGSMMLLLINGCGLDRRIILSLLCSGNTNHFSGVIIILKACTAAYFLSIISNRHIITATIIQYLTPVYQSLQSKQHKQPEPNFEVMQHIVNNAIQVASTIGSNTMIHSALTPLTMRAIWATHPGLLFQYPDIFNFLQYTCFALPLTLLMFILTSGYHMVLMIVLTKKTAMSSATMTKMKEELQKEKNALPKYKKLGHETLSLIFYILYLVLSFTRWCPWLQMGWSTYFRHKENIPAIKDVTVAALFVVLLHILPRACNTFKIFTAKTKSELGPIKPESSIMWWRFTDKNINYFYIVVIGSGIALNTSVRVSGLGQKIAEYYATFLTDQSLLVSLLIIILCAAVLSNVMSGVPACCIIMPFVLNMVSPSASSEYMEEWQKKLYLGALAVGMGTSLGFLGPFLNTPAYFCHRVGNVPIKKMIMYSILPLIICIIILWVGIYAYGPIIFDPSGEGISVDSLMDLNIDITPPPLEDASTPEAVPGLI